MASNFLVAVPRSSEKYFVPRLLSVHFAARVFVFLAKNDHFNVFQETLGASARFTGLWRLIRYSKVIRRWTARCNAQAHTHTHTQNEASFTIESLRASISWPRCSIRKELFKRAAPFFPSFLFCNGRSQFLILALAVMIEIVFCFYVSGESRRLHHLRHLWVPQPATSSVSCAT